MAWNRDAVSRLTILDLSDIRSAHEILAPPLSLTERSHWPLAAGPGPVSREFTILLRLVLFESLHTRTAHTQICVCDFNNRTVGAV